VTAAWTPDSCNTCPHCKNCIDADDVFDGAEVRCLGCRRWFIVDICGEGDDTIASLREAAADDFDDCQAGGSTVEHVPGDPELLAAIKAAVRST
jgi:hypothetical protein